jgi:RNA polymerase sigma factor (sigma-70 family)
MQATSQPGQKFLPTRWTIVLTAGQEASPQAQDALATLCRTYWYPIYAYIRRRGHSPPDAEDLTQEFFARLLEKHYLAGIRREGGRFRSFLLAAVNGFLANEWDRIRAQKRGGGQKVLSIDRDTAESRYHLEPAHELSPERIYERQWAQTLLGEVLARLREEYHRQGKSALFAGISASLSQPRGAVPYADLAARLNTTEAAIKMAVQRLRSRYRELLRAEIAETLTRPSDVEEEIRFLFSTFSQ